MKTKQDKEIEKLRNKVNKKDKKEYSISGGIYNIFETLFFCPCCGSLKSPIGRTGLSWYQLCRKCEREYKYTPDDPSQYCIHAEAAAWNITCHASHNKYGIKVYDRLLCIGDLRCPEYVSKKEKESGLGNMTKGIKAKDIREFEKLCDKLDDLMVRIHEYQPEATLFVAGECTTSFNLCVGFDDANTMSERAKTIVTQVDVSYADCGGF